MNVSKELLEKAKAAKSAEELLALAKAEKFELTEEEAAKAFANSTRRARSLTRNSTTLQAVAATP